MTPPEEGATRRVERLQWRAGRRQRDTGQQFTQE